MTYRDFTIAVAVNNMEVLRKNLYLSPGLFGEGRNQLVIKQEFPSASLAYNSAIDEAENDIIVFVHQDVYLPEGWFSDLQQCIAYLEGARIQWGVLGCFGSRKGADGGLGRVYTNGLGFHGRIINKPEPIETLDEIILLIRKSSGLRFDPLLPHFHLYGTDICLSARARGLPSFVFQGFCIHNTNQLLTLPAEFYDCYRYIKKKWRRFLPIYASCITISSFNKDLYWRKSQSLTEKVFGRKLPQLRVDDPRSVLGQAVPRNVGACDDM